MADGDAATWVVRGHRLHTADDKNDGVREQKLQNAGLSEQIRILSSISLARQPRASPRTRGSLAASA